MDITSLILGLIAGGAVGAAAMLWRSRGEIHALSVELATVEARHDAESRAQAEKLALLTAAEDKLTATFKNLANDALSKSIEANNQQFLQLAEGKLKEAQAGHKTDLTELLTPLKSNLDQLAQYNQSVEKNRAGAYESLTQQILTLKDETTRLSRALRAPQTRGRWGEVQLQRLIELAGLEPHTDYSLQSNFTTDEGRLRPDCIISLPGGKRVVIDVKTPLEAYLDAEEATDEAGQREALVRYGRHVKKHVQQLSDKSYWKQLDFTPDYVIMFLPGEHFMSAALREMPDLFDEALQRQVILASTSTLMILLKAYAYSWRQESIVENAVNVTRVGREMFGRLEKLSAYFDNLGTHLSRAMKSYNEAVGSYESRVLTQARKFGDFGILENRAQAEALTINPIEEVAPRRLAASSPLEESADILPLKAEK